MPGLLPLYPSNRISGIEQVPPFGLLLREAGTMLKSIVIVAKNLDKFDIAYHKPPLSALASAMGVKKASLVLLLTWQSVLTKSNEGQADFSVSSHFHPKGWRAKPFYLASIANLCYNRTDL